MYYMGNANNKLPAPYELGNGVRAISNGIYPEASYLAKGGKASKGHKGMTKVHMNRDELSILDHMQGGPEHGPEGVKVYSHLEELLKNPHIVRNVHHHSQQHRHHHADGGIERLREGGRNGDSEIAMIGPNTHRLFNQIAGYPTRNPNTGHPEYWSIGPALSGISGALGGALGKLPGMFSSGMRAAAPMLQNAASGIGNALKSDQFKNFASGALNATQPLIQNALNKNLGNDWGGIAGAVGQTAQNQYLGQGDPNSIWNQAGQAAGAGINKYSQGANPQQAAGYGMQQLGQDMGGGVGQGLSGFGGALAGGQNFRNAAQQGGQDFYGSMGGGQGMRNAARDIGNNFVQGGYGGGQQAMRNQMSQYMQRAMPQPANRSLPYNQGYGMQQGDYDQGYNPYDESYMYG